MLTDITLPALEYVSLHMRDQDRVEILGMNDFDTPIAFAWTAFGALINKGRGRIAWHNGKPAAWIGMVELYKGVWQITMGGTDDMPKVALACMRWARENIPELVAPPLDGYRMHCDARCGPEYAENHKFLRALGAKEEGPPRMLGKDKGVYQCFVWLLGENAAIVNDKAVGVR